MASIKFRASRAKEAQGKKNPAGRWQARVRRKDGKHVTRSFRTLADAEAWARMVESEQERGIWRDTREAERLTLREAIKRYRKERTAKKRGKAQEESILAILEDEPIADLALARIGSSDIAAMLDRWGNADLAPATIQRRTSVLGHLLEVASKSWGLALVNPVRLVELPKIANARSRRLEAGELEAICAATGSKELVTWISLSVETAMRRGELALLRWEHVDLQQRVIHLPKTATKNGNARGVPLSSRAVALLEGLKEAAVGQQSKVVKLRPAERVLSVRADAATRAFERAVTRARRNYEEECEAGGRQPDPRFLVDLRFHDLRHEATSRLADKLAAHELAAVTGHRDLRMVMRYYHPRAADLAKKIG